MKMTMITMMTMTTMMMISDNDDNEDDDKDGDDDDDDAIQLQWSFVTKFLTEFLIAVVFETFIKLSCC